MPNRVRILEVPETDRVVLERRIRDRGALARDVQRARIVLLSAQGLAGPQIAERVGCTEPTVVLWRGGIDQVWVSNWSSTSCDLGVFVY
jgi:hypothetical protein